MRFATIISFLFALILFFSCKDKNQVKVEEIKLETVKASEQKDPPIPPAPEGLKVSAYLIYEDNTVSKFDILNDKTIALWNTVIGAGDAVKPSNKTKLLFTGQLDSLTLTINNGKRKPIVEQLPKFSGDYEYILPDTGCDEVKVVVSKLDKILYIGIIPFRCGE